MKKDWKKKSLVAALVAALLLPVLSCSKNAKKEAVDTIIYSWSLNAGPLNPHGYFPNQLFAQAMVYDPLVKLNDDGTIGPALAESWDISPDGIVYTFHLRKGVTFTDGEPFNAKAVELNFKAIMGNAGRHAWLGVTSRIEKYEAVGEYDFRLTLSSAYYPTLDDLALPRPFRFLSPASFPDDGDTSKEIKSPVGTGPWKFVETALGEYDLFERNDSYWGGSPDAAKVLVKVIPDPVTRGLAFESGDINFIYGMGQVNYDTFERLRSGKDVGSTISGPMGTVTLALNSAYGPTKELAVRKALQHFTNKKEIVNGVTLGTQIAADTYFAPNVPYCDLDLQAYAYDPEKAAALLDGAGWTLAEGKTIREKNGVPLEIDFCFVGNDAAQKAIAEVMQGQALKLGVSFKLLGEEDDSFYRRQKSGEFGMIFSDTWGPPYEPHAMVSGMLVPAHADYMAQVGLTMKAQIDDSIREVILTSDPARRAAIYKYVLTTLHEQAVYLPLYYNAMFEVHRNSEVSSVRFGSDKFSVPFENVTLRRQ